MPPILALLRPHQWVKNLLVFVALITSHRWRESAAILDAIMLFGAFCLAASAIYAINDVLDRELDAQHPEKRHRPIASGALSPVVALVIAIVLLAIAGAMVWPLGALTASTLATYVAISVLYCVWIKRALWIDVIALAALYVLRVVAGAFAIGVQPSPWLLAFAGFVFLSLATLKRYAELRRSAVENLAGRAYQRGDEAPVLAIGAGSGVVAVLVLALYVNSPDVVLLYQRPQWIWLLCPAVLYWLARIWTLAARAQLSADPIVFALRDQASWLVLAAFAVIIAMAL